MTDLDLAEIQDRFGDDLRPTDERYSIILIDRSLPLSDPDCTIKGYESDELVDLPLPDTLEMAIVALRDDGTIIEVA